MKYNLERVEAEFVTDLKDFYRSATKCQQKATKRSD